MRFAAFAIKCGFLRAGRDVVEHEGGERQVSY